MEKSGRSCRGIKKGIEKNKKKMQKITFEKFIEEYGDCDIMRADLFMKNANSLFFIAITPNEEISPTNSLVTDEEAISSDEPSHHLAGDSTQ